MGSLQVMLFVLSIAMGNPFASVEDVVIVTKQDMEAAIENPEYMILRILYRDEDPEHNQEIANHLEEIYKNRRGYFKTVAYDCTRDVVTCPELYTQIDRPEDPNPKLSYESGVYPALKFFIPFGLNPFGGKPLVNQSGFGNRVKQEHLARFVDEHVPFMGDIIKDKECLEDWEDETLNKVIMFGKAKMPPPEWAAQTSRFKGKLSFAYMQDTYSKDYLPKYDVTKYPTVYALADGKHIRHDGEMTLQDLEAFCHQFAHEEIAKVVFRKPGEHDEDKFLFSEVNQQETWEEKVASFADKAKKMKRKYSKPEAEDL